MATFRMRPGLRKSDPNPQSSRALSVRFGARWRARRRTISCCLSRRFSAITARSPPGPHSCAATTARWSKVSGSPSHARDTVGQTSGAMQRCLNPVFGERTRISRRTGTNFVSARLTDGRWDCTPACELFTRARGADADRALTGVQAAAAFNS
jgi:hypothetical protein